MMIFALLVVLTIIVIAILAILTHVDKKNKAKYMLGILIAGVVGGFLILTTGVLLLTRRRRQIVPVIDDANQTITFHVDDDDSESQEIKVNNDNINTPESNQVVINYLNDQKENLAEEIRQLEEERKNLYVGKDVWPHLKEKKKKKRRILLPPLEASPEYDQKMLQLQRINLETKLLLTYIEY